MLSIGEQEDFMHMIFDCIHIGVSLESLEWSLKSMKDQYNEKLLFILNEKMKNEKYSNSFIYPLEKAIKESSSHVDNDIDKFFERKIEAIKMLIAYGCSLKIIFKINIDWDDLLSRQIINKKIYNFIFNKIDKISITI
jgi:hypothetical protein